MSSVRVPPWDPEQEDAFQDNEQLPGELTPLSLGPQRSHSFCKKRRGPFVVSVTVVIEERAGGIGPGMLLCLCPQRVKPAMA